MLITQIRNLCEKAAAKFLLAAIVQGDVQKKGSKQGSNTCFAA
jgi:hypothetical protein